MLPIAVSLRMRQLENMNSASTKFANSDASGIDRSCLQPLADKCFRADGRSVND